MLSSTKRAKVLSALSIAAAAGIGSAATQAHAATLTSYYVNAVISTTPTPAKEVFTGTGTNSTVVSVTGASPTITVPVGDYVGYGVAAVLTNNINAAGGTTYGDSGGDTIVDPTNLGLADIGYSVLNVSANDTNGSLLQPTLGAVRGTAGTLVQYNDTAVNGGLGKVPGGSPKNGYTFASHDGGDAEAGSGLVGSGFQIFEGNASVDPTSATGYNSLTYFAGVTASSTTAVTAFDSLDYTAVAAGTVTLQPAIDTTATQYWFETTPGGASTPASYIATYFSGADTINPLPVLTIQIVGGVTTTPTGHAILNLSATASSTYGSLLGHLTVTGKNGSYTVAQVTGLTGATGSVEGNGFNPATDTEIYALDVLVNGAQATATQLGTLITEIGSFSGGLASGLSVSSTLAQDPFASNYNLFLTATGAITGTGDNFLGYDLSSQDPALTGYSVSAVALVPEPMSLGMLALGGLGLLSRRRGGKAVQA